MSKIVLFRFAHGKDRCLIAAPEILRASERYIRARGSAGRAPRSQRGGRGFDPLRVHQIRTAILIQCVSKLRFFLFA